MEELAEKIRRYKHLLHTAGDERACKVLMELIAEAEARLHAMKRKGEQRSGMKGDDDARDD
jgi:hypothetical protein